MQRWSNHYGLNSKHSKSTMPLYFTGSPITLMLFVISCLLIPAVYAFNYDIAPTGLSSIIFRLRTSVSSTSTRIWPFAPVLFVAIGFSFLISSFGGWNLFLNVSIIFANQKKFNVLRMTLLARYVMASHNGINSSPANLIISLWIGLLAAFSESWVLFDASRWIDAVTGLWWRAAQTSW